MTPRTGDRRDDPPCGPSGAGLLAPADRPDGRAADPEPDVDRSGSLGDLVKDATVHLSTLVRSEIELAKLELSASLKEALRGSAFFAATAAATALFSLFFFWLMIAEIIAIWLPRWAAFVIVFVVMLLIAALLGYLGLRRMKKVKAPEQTIAEFQQTAEALKEAVSPVPPARPRWAPPTPGRLPPHSAPAERRPSGRESSPDPRVASVRRVSP